MKTHVPEVERLIGIEVYATDSRGVGGRIRQSPEDFVVEETLVDGSIATFDPPQISEAVLGSSSEGNKFLLCRLVKKNWDTFAVLKQITKQLGIDDKRIQIAGIKDARAITAQHLTIRGVSEEDVKRVNVKDVELTAIGYVRRELSPYYSRGNRFRLLISGIKLDERAAEERLGETTRQIRELGGVPNFFGHQRFGTTRPVTHMVGRALVNRDLEQAAMTFLAKSFLDEHPESRAARRRLETSRDFAGALAEFPKQLRYERLMLRVLAKDPGDFVAAFRTLPLKLRELFVQAYQSYLFNKVLSRRLLSGMSLRRAEVGDFAVAVDNTGVLLKATATRAKESDIERMNERLKAGRMRVCIPLFGSRPHFSGGRQGEIERSVFEEENVSTVGFEVEDMPEIGSRGGLRAVLSPTSDLVVQSSLSSISTGTNVSVNFSLQKGCYATVVLRELMKLGNPREAGF